MKVYRNIQMGNCFSKVGQIQDSILNRTKQEQRTPYFAGLLAKYGVFLTIQMATQPNRVTPIRCRILQLKQIRLGNMIPAILIILIAHIIIAIRWMLIKILSVVINGREWFKVNVPGGCCLALGLSVTIC